MDEKPCCERRSLEISAIIDKIFNDVSIVLWLADVSEDLTATILGKIEEAKCQTR